MANESVSRLVLRMEPEVASIAQTISRVLTELHSVPAGSVVRTSEAVEHLAEETTRLALNWMGTGNIEDVEQLHERIGDILRQEEDVLLADAKLPPHQRLLWAIRYLAQTLAVFLQSRNMSRSLGLLSGERRQSWREAIGAIHELDRPVRAGDLLKMGLFKNKGSTANNALNQMADMGFLEKHQQGQAVTFSLSWTGRALAKHMFGQDRPPIPIVHDNGFSDQAIRQSVGQDSGKLIFKLSDWETGSKARKALIK